MAKPCRHPGVARSISRQDKMGDVIMDLKDNTAGVGGTAKLALALYARPPA